MDEGQRVQDAEGLRDGYGVSRLLALSDGVFAIAMTLLVLNIPLPRLPGNAPEEQVRRAFFEVTPDIGVFVLSFMLVGIYWMVHHRQFRTARVVNHEGWARTQG